MNINDLTRFKELLETELERVDAELGIGLPEGENANCSHQAEVAGAAQDRMALIAIRNLRRDRRAQIIAARARIEQETFGICVRCRGNIERDRLEAIPFTPLCIACANHRLNPHPR